MALESGVKKWNQLSWNKEQMNKMFFNYPSLLSRFSTTCLYGYIFINTHYASFTLIELKYA